MCEASVLLVGIKEAKIKREREKTQYKYCITLFDALTLRFKLYIVIEFMLKYVAEEQRLIDSKKNSKTYVYGNINLYLQYTKQRLRNSPLHSLILCNRYSMFLFSLHSSHQVQYIEMYERKKAHIPENAR